MNRPVSLCRTPSLPPRRAGTPLNHPFSFVIHPSTPSFPPDPLTPRFRAPLQRPPEKANSYQKKRDPIDVILNETSIPLRQRDASLPKNLCEVIDRALALKYQERYRLAGEMLPLVKNALGW